MERRFKIDPEGLPDLTGMMLAVTDALRSIGGSASIEELDEKVIEQEGLTEEEQSFTMRNDESKPRVNYYLAWARTYLKRGGALENSKRGVWALTEKGLSLTTYEEARDIYEQVQREERERARLKRLAAKNANSNAADDKSIPDFAPDPESEGDWRSELLAALSAMSSDGFERLAQRLLREAGFTKVEVRGKSGDGGIDGVGVLRVNLVSFQVYFQCKKWKGSVGAKEIRDFRGAMQGRADKGLFVTTGRFTAQASDEATRDGATAIDLIDGPRLCDLLKQQGLGVRTEMIEQVSVNSDWFKTI
ncbi:restriction endonuclease [Futiania mangrovi]|uniref:Restriction endonuclease n=1 Tax=Futiania mangrovi TaxID=2959716 RepID=A0A9J6PHG4_9PROT|nr:restriction endonuclease [Futiania mangrovii]MCP1337243.1 restriction endonuclease [Futiania mangrovii]